MCNGLPCGNQRWLFRLSLQCRFRDPLGDGAQRVRAVLAVCLRPLVDRELRVSGRSAAYDIKAVPDLLKAAERLSVAPDILHRLFKHFDHRDGAIPRYVDKCAVYTVA